MKKVVFIILFLFSLTYINLIDSQIQIGNEGEEGVNFVKPNIINYSIVNVNNSDYLDGQHGSYYTGYCDTKLGDYLLLNGSSVMTGVLQMNSQSINNIYNLTVIATSIFGGTSYDIANAPTVYISGIGNNQIELDSRSQNTGFFMRTNNLPAGAGDDYYIFANGEAFHFFDNSANSDIFAFDKQMNVFLAFDYYNKRFGWGNVYIGTNNSYSHFGKTNGSLAVGNVSIWGNGTLQNITSICNASNNCYSLANLLNDTTGSMNYTNIFLTNKSNDVNGFGIFNISYLGFSSSVSEGDYSLNFTGTSRLDSVNVPETAGTISMWIKPQQTINSATDKGLLIDGTTASKIIVRWKGNLGKLDFYVNDGGWGLTSSTTTTWNAGTWYHIVLTWNATANKVFINGVNEANGTGKIPSADSEILKIGIGYYSTTPLYFNGTIDEFMLFNRSLSDAEVTTLYNSGNGFYGDITQAPTNANLVIGYHFDEGTGGTTRDYSGNGYTGTQVSTTYAVGKVANPSGYTATISQKNVTYINGTWSFDGKITASNILYNNGSSSNFIKGDGSYDSTAYYKSGDSAVFSNIQDNSGASYVNYVVCYLTDGVLGHCTSAVDESGLCSCAGN